jgi:hypothetical protein
MGLRLQPHSLVHELATIAGVQASEWVGTGRAIADLRRLSGRTLRYAAAVMTRASPISHRRDIRKSSINVTSGRYVTPRAVPVTPRGSKPVFGSFAALSSSQIRLFQFLDAVGKNTKRLI